MLIFIDSDWPEIFSVTPEGGDPGDFFTIIGRNFNKTPEIQVYISHFQSPNHTVINDTHIVARVPGAENFLS